MAIIDPGQLMVRIGKNGQIEVTKKSSSGASKSSSGFDVRGMSPQEVEAILEKGFSSKHSGSGQFTDEQKDLIRLAASGKAKTGQTTVSQAEKADIDAYYSSNSPGAGTNPNSVGVVQFDPNTGRRLNEGETVTYQGKTYKQGDVMKSDTPISNAPTSSPNSTTSNTGTKPIIGYNAAGQPIYGGAGTLSDPNSNQGGSSSGSSAGGFNPTTGASTTGSTGSSTSSATIGYDPSLTKYGITQDVWNQMSANQRAVVSAATGAAQALAGANASDVTLQKALDAAKKDPTLIAKYADALKMDTQSFSQQLDYLQQATSNEAQQQQMQFENDRRQLAENSAAAGQAYSGLRGRAQQQLGEQESGIVSSSRNALQKSLNDLTSAFESKYGSDATKAAKAQFGDPFASSNVGLSGLMTTGNSSPFSLSGKLAGGITGTNNIAKQNDINNLAGQYVTLGQLPKFT